MAKCRTSRIVRRSVVCSAAVLAAVLLLCAAFLIGRHLTRPIVLQGTVVPIPGDHPSGPRALVWLEGARPQEFAKPVDEVELSLQASAWRNQHVRVELKALEEAAKE